MAKKYVLMLFSAVFVLSLNQVYANTDDQQNTIADEDESDDTTEGEDDNEEEDTVDESVSTAKSTVEQGTSVATQPTSIIAVSQNSQTSSTIQQSATTVVNTSAPNPVSMSTTGNVSTNNIDTPNNDINTINSSIKTIDIPQDTLTSGKINAVSGWNIRQYGYTHGLHAVLWPANTSWEMADSAIFVFVNDRTQPSQNIEGANIFSMKCPHMSIIKLPDLYRKDKLSLFRFFSGANRQYNVLQHIDGGKYSVIILYAGPKKQEAQAVLADLSAQYKNALATSAGTVASVQPQ